ncbi:MAG: TIGR03643 family protein [Microscillaceae bacterium]|nr:TIGR03643 family protein [Microscillaceae bacterium]
MKKNKLKALLPEEIDRIIEMAWEDRTPFEAILGQFGLHEGEVIQLMRQQISPEAWRRWRKRVQGRPTKHLARRVREVNRFKCSRQKGISQNKIAKRA